MSNNDKYGPIFIVGLPRSGTTLVSNLLNSTKDIYIGTETHFFQVYAQWLKGKFSKTKGLSFVDYYFNKRAKSNSYLQYFPYSEQEFDTLYRKCKETDNLNEILRTICNSQNDNDRRWGEKTPGHFEFMNQICDVDERVNVICVTRDPRDVYLSHLNVQWSNKNPYSFYLRVKKLHRVVEKYKNNNRFFIIRYEDLIQHPDETLLTLFGNVGLRYDSNILTKFGEATNRNFDLTKEPWKKNNLKELKSDNCNKWKSVYDSDIKMRVLNSLLKKYIVNSDYEYRNSMKLSLTLVNFYYMLKHTLNKQLQSIRIHIKNSLYSMNIKVK